MPHPQLALRFALAFLSVLSSGCANTVTRTDGARASVATPAQQRACLEGDVVACGGVSPEAAAVAWRARCLAGDVPACRRADALATLGVWPPEGPAQHEADIMVAAPLPAGSACSDAEPSACLRKALDAIAAGGRSKAARTAAQQACGAGLARGCVLEGQLALDPLQGRVEPDAERAFARACTLGSAVGCSVEAMLLLQGAPARADRARQARARVLLEEACRLGSAMSCNLGAELIDESVGIAVALGRAQTLRRIACERDGDPVACQAFTRAAPRVGGPALSREPSVETTRPMDVIGQELVTWVNACGAGIGLACRAARAGRFEHEHRFASVAEACARGDVAACREELRGARAELARTQLSAACDVGALDACAVLDDADPKTPSRACARGAVARCFSDPSRASAGALRALSTATPDELDRACEEGLRAACLALVSSGAVSPAANAATSRVCNAETTVDCLPVARYLATTRHDVARALELFGQACAGGQSHACTERGALLVATGDASDPAVQRARAEACERSGGDACAQVDDVDVLSRGCERHRGTSVACSRYLALTTTAPAPPLPRMFPMSWRAEALRARAKDLEDKRCIIRDGLKCPRVGQRPDRVWPYEEIARWTAADGAAASAELTSALEEAFALEGAACALEHEGACLARGRALLARDPSRALAQLTAVCDRTTLRAFAEARADACLEAASLLLTIAPAARDPARARALAEPECGPRSRSIRPLCGVWPRALAATGASRADVRQAQQALCTQFVLDACVDFVRDAKGAERSSRDVVAAARTACAQGRGRSQPPRTGGVCDVAATRLTPPDEKALAPLARVTKAACKAGDAHRCLAAAREPGVTPAEAQELWDTACRLQRVEGCQALLDAKAPRYGTQQMACALGVSTACEGGAR